MEARDFLYVLKKRDGASGEGACIVRNTMLDNGDEGHVTGELTDLLVSIGFSGDMLLGGLEARPGGRGERAAYKRSDLI